jgi:hypothetical protein
MLNTGAIGERIALRKCQQRGEQLSHVPHGDDTIPGCSKMMGLEWVRGQCIDTPCSMGDRRSGTTEIE